jgi:hypothetical protein
MRFGNWNAEVFCSEGQLKGKRKACSQLIFYTTHRFVFGEYRK